MLDFLQKPQTEKENFWSLLIEPEWITSAIWQVKDGKVEVVASSPPTRWEDNFLEAIDTSLSACSQFLPESMPDPSKTVFGVPNSWVDAGNIKPEKLDELKVVCEKLSLVPSGFVVLSEAISHYLKNEDQGATNVLMVGLSDQNLEIAVFNLGLLTGVTNVLRSVSIEDDLTEGLTRLASGVENFPSKIVLYNQKEQELEEVKELLNNADWEKVGQGKFVHTPRIEIFDPSKKIIAVSLAGGSELGEIHGVEEARVEETKVEELPVEEVENIAPPTEVTAQDLGFEIDVPKKLELPKFNFPKPNIKIPKFNFKLNSQPLVIVGPAILTLLLVGFLYWWFAPKANVTIYVSPQKIEENLEISLDSGLSVKNNEVSVSGEKTNSTTGTKTVGEKAKGSVFVQNGTNYPINLPVGTVLVSSADLRFVTTESASISGRLSPNTPGTATIDVEAGDIGSEYNINKDEVFKVANYPKLEVDATSTDSFSGGSSRQISSVSEDDRKKILEQLTDELLEDAKSKLSGQIDDSQLLVDSSFEIESLDEQFSNKVGDEAGSIKLSLNMDVKIKSITKSELSTKATEVLNSKIPSGFILKDDQISYKIESDEDSFIIKITANLLPDINEAEIAKKIAGKYPKLAEDFFESVPGFTKAEFKIKPLFPGKLGTLPHVAKRMNVSFAVDQ